MAIRLTDQFARRHRARQILRNRAPAKSGRPVDPELLPEPVRKVSPGCAHGLSDPLRRRADDLAVLAPAALGCRTLSA